MFRMANRWCEVMCCVLTKDSPRTLMQPSPGERKYQRGVSNPAIIISHIRFSTFSIEFSNICSHRNCRFIPGLYNLCCCFPLFTHVLWLLHQTKNVFIFVAVRGNKNQSGGPKSREPAWINEKQSKLPKAKSIVDKFEVSLEACLLRKSFFSTMIDVW